MATKQKAATTAEVKAPAVTVFKHEAISANCIARTTRIGLKKYVALHDVFGIYSRHIMNKLDKTKVLTQRVLSQAANEKLNSQVMKMYPIADLKAVLTAEDRRRGVKAAPGKAKPITKLTFDQVKARLHAECSPANLTQEVATLAEAQQNQLRDEIKRLVSKYATKLFSLKGVHRSELSEADRDDVYRTAYRTLYVEFRRVLASKLHALGSSLVALNLNETQVKTNKDEPDKDYLTRVQEAGFLQELRDVARALFLRK